LNVPTFLNKLKEEEEEEEEDNLFKFAKNEK
jgi:hypothetical protein